MLDKFWNVIKSGGNLIDGAKNNSLVMLTTAREMFHIVVDALDEEPKHNVRKQVGRMDKQINHEQSELRKKVFEHLSLSKGKNLLPGLQLTSIAIDLERLGDYMKNLGELVDMMPGQLDFGVYSKEFNEMKEITGSLFELTKDAMMHSDTQKGRDVMRRYNRVSKLCDQTIETIFREQGEEETVGFYLVSVVLMLRYMKRVAAHLKNICSAIVNPFHRIGFRLEDF